MTGQFRSGPPGSRLPATSTPTNQHQTSTNLSTTHLPSVALPPLATPATCITTTHFSAVLPSPSRLKVNKQNVCHHITPLVQPHQPPLPRLSFRRKRWSNPASSAPQRTALGLHTSCYSRVRIDCLTDTSISRHLYCLAPHLYIGPIHGTALMAVGVIRLL